MLTQSSPTASETETIPTTSSAVSSSVAPSESPSKSGGWDFLNDLWPAESSSSTKDEVKTQTKTKPQEPKLTGAELRESLNNDLRQWQNKFAVAADKGSEDLDQRVAEITERQIENGVKGLGAALVVELEETAESTIAKFKQIIKDTVKAIPEDATEQDLEAAYEKCIAKTRELGLEVKEKAQSVRDWKAKYDQETDNFVKAAVKSTVDVLERIHGLGLQEVGMRWAWTDGVTYKDWQKYHKLRNTLNEWQAEVEAVGSQHQGLKTAHEEAKNLEDKAMNTASKMVSELVRLKNVSRWKIWANDATDDFSDKEVPARIFKAAENVASNVEDAASKVSEAVVGSETPASESIASSAKEKVSEISSKASELLGSSSTPLPESVASDIEEKVAGSSSTLLETMENAKSGLESSATDAAQSVESKIQEEKEKVEEKISFASAEQGQQKVMGGAMAQVIAEAKDIIFDDEDDTYSRKIQSMAGEAEDRAADLSRAVSEALLGPSKTQGSVESITSLASEQYEKALAAASSVLYGTEQQPIESATSVASEKFAQAVTA